MNTASRSKTSTLGSMLSPWMSSGRSCSCIASNTGYTARRSATPESELVVAPAGYILIACTWSCAAARATSSGVVFGVRYSVIKGWKSEPDDNASSTRPR